jgi:hypothetical protein
MRVFHQLSDIVTLVEGYMTRISRSSAGYFYAREAERLFGLTDAELADMGLSRDRIVRHAFGGIVFL